MSLLRLLSSLALLSCCCPLSLSLEATHATVAQSSSRASVAPLYDQFIIPASEFRDAHAFDPLRDPQIYPTTVTSPAAVTEWFRKDMRRRQRSNEDPNPPRFPARPLPRLPFPAGTYYQFLETQSARAAASRPLRQSSVSFRGEGDPFALKTNQRTFGTVTSAETDLLKTNSRHANVDAEDNVDSHSQLEVESAISTRMSAKVRTQIREALRKSEDTVDPVYIYPISPDSP